MTVRDRYPNAELVVRRVRERGGQPHTTDPIFWCGKGRPAPSWP
jgi:hypothetical protein